MNHEDIVEKEWLASAQQRISLKEHGAQETFATLPGFFGAFNTHAYTFSILCIDEGCTGSGTHLAGSGCGVEESILLEELRTAGITEFTTHEGCGAWALARPDLTEHQEKEAAVIAWGKDIAAKLDVPYRHIAASEMKRPAELHNAFYALYDTTGLFNRNEVHGMSAGFVTSPKWFASAKDDLELAATIAFGPHGFGQKFDAQHPFVLIGIVDPNNQEFTKELVVADLNEVKNGFPRGNIAIDTIELY
jgi:hypothetical protein